MNGIREKKDSRVRYERDYDDYESYPTRKRSNDSDNFASSRYPEERRVTNRSSYSGYRDSYRYEDTDDSNDIMYDSRYYRSEPEMRISVSDARDGKSKKSAKKRISGRAKVFIAVYTLIFVTILTMILINAIPGASAQTGAETTKPEIVIDESALTKATNDKGEGSNVVLVPTNPTYEYESSTNWFDGFCKWIENLVG